MFGWIQMGEKGGGILKGLKDWILVTSKNETYSYTDILMGVLTKKRPKRILEWGPGRSTMLMHDLLPDSQINSVEHDWKWYLRWLLGIRGVNLHYIKLDGGYASPDFPEKYFDFIFIDGKQRVKCMKTALRLLKDNGLLMLHDSNREKYREGIKLFKIVEKKGNTILLKK